MWSWLQASLQLEPPALRSALCGVRPTRIGSDDCESGPRPLAPYAAVVSTIHPMKAVSGTLPVGPSWVYEPKWDGMRAVVHIADGQVRLWSGSGREVTVAYPELTHPPAEPSSTDGALRMVLDGEIVALDEYGRPSFERLQHRMHVTGGADGVRRPPDRRSRHHLVAVERTPPAVGVPGRRTSQWYEVEPGVHRRRRPVRGGRATGPGRPGGPNDPTGRMRRADGAPIG
jgi:hypothetical protein